MINTGYVETFDTALYKLYKEGKISIDEALHNADAANNLRLKIDLGEKSAVHDGSGHQNKGKKKK